MQKLYTTALKWYTQPYVIERGSKVSKLGTYVYATYICMYFDMYTYNFGFVHTHSVHVYLLVCHFHCHLSSAQPVAALRTQSHPGRKKIVHFSKLNLSKTEISRVQPHHVNSKSCLLQLIANHPVPAQA